MFFVWEGMGGVEKRKNFSTDREGNGKQAGERWVTFKNNNTPEKDFAANSFKQKLNPRGQSSMEQPQKKTP